MEFGGGRVTGVGGSVLNTRLPLLRLSWTQEDSSDLHLMTLLGSGFRTHVARPDAPCRCQRVGRFSSSGYPRLLQMPGNPQPQPPALQRQRPRAHRAESGAHRSPRKLVQCSRVAPAGGARSSSSSLWGARKGFRKKGAYFIFAFLSYKEHTF